MTTRAEEFSNELERKGREIQAILASLGDAEWRKVCVPEGWPLGLVAFHIALGVERQAGWIEDATKGRAPFEFSWEVTDGMNAAVARAGIVPSKPFVLAALGAGLDRTAGLLQEMSDEDLDRGAVVYQGKTLSVRHVTRIFMRHIEEHFASIRNAIGG